MVEALEQGCLWLRTCALPGEEGIIIMPMAVTTDRDYARFPDLRWRHPLE